MVIKILLVGFSFSFLSVKKRGCKDLDLYDLCTFDVCSCISSMCNVYCVFRPTCVKLEQGWEPVGVLMDCTALLEPIEKLSDISLSLDMIVPLKNDSIAL